MELGHSHAYGSYAQSSSQPFNAEYLAHGIELKRNAQIE
jgi:hypothetical protein